MDRRDFLKNSFATCGALGLSTRVRGASVSSEPASGKLHIQ